MMRKPRIVFMGTAKTGLGHLRRLATIAGRVKGQAPGLDLMLMTNAVPKGISELDLEVFSETWVCERHEMAARLERIGCDLAVLDTLKLPGFEAYSGKAFLILRETPNANIEGFRRNGQRPWDCIIVPNPKHHWYPDVGPDFAKLVDPVGWIRRATGARGDSPSAGIVLATGGGGTVETRKQLYPVLDAVIAETRRRVTQPLVLKQALGPRSGGDGLTEADRYFDPGGDLNDVFRRADVVISTAGYNSVLELAGTDTPTLLTAIPRSLDDQMARVRTWGPQLGFGLDPDRPHDAASWLAEVIETPRRRPLVDLGADGADRAASRILDLLCPVS